MSGNYHITGVDSSQQMIERAQKRFSKNPEIDIQHISIFDVEPQEGGYAAITCSLMSHNITRYEGMKRKFIEKLYALMSP